MGEENKKLYELENELSGELIAKLKKKAKNVVEGNFFCNVGTKEYPADVFKYLAENEEKDMSALKKVEVYGDYEHWVASELLATMNNAAIDLYDAMVYAIGQYKTEYGRS